MAPPPYIFLPPKQTFLPPNYTHQTLTLKSPKSLHNPHPHTPLSLMGHEASPSPATTTTTTALAPGFRFHPTDEELVRFYLKRKVCGDSFHFDAISDIDIYKSEPWDLPGKSGLKSRDLEWYFFCALDRKYENGWRLNRATGKGYWKATGKDRSVKYDSRDVGLKKTLVFHKGRAPGGKRTDWVMHEYRLVDEELKKTGVALDAYVLCRVFQKSGLGPPRGDRYVPFVEGEWDDDRSVFVPGAEAADGVVAVDDAGLEGNDLEQATQSNKSSLCQREHSRDSHDASFVCKIERQEDCPLPSMDEPEPFPIIQNKRSRHNNEDPSDSHASENSTTTTQDLCLSLSTATMTAAAAGAAAPTIATTMTAAAAAPTTTKSNFSFTPFEFPLLESIESRESPPGPMQRFDAVALDIPVPPGILEFINNLQKEIHNISTERETLKIKVMSSQAMINILQSRIEFLNKENEDLKRIVRNV